MDYTPIICFSLMAFFYIYIKAYISINSAGSALLKEGEERNNQNLLKAGEKLSKAGFLLVMIAGFTIILGITVTLIFI